MKRVARNTDRLFSRRAFSLVELMIVIGIIIILIGIVLAVMSIVHGKNEERTTRATLTILDAAMKEWERQVDRRVTFPNSATEAGNWDVPWDPVLNDLQPPPGAPLGNLPSIYQANAAGQPSFLEFRRMIWLLNRISQQDTVRNVLTKIPEDSFHRIRQPMAANFIYFTLMEVTDAWGKPVIAVFPGRDWVDGVDSPALRDLDGTVRTPLEQLLGIACRHQQVLFVSAGPDGFFNNVASTGEIDERADNLYSYEPEGP